jgi:hypothetical protein
MDRKALSQMRADILRRFGIISLGLALALICVEAALRLAGWFYLEIPRLLRPALPGRERILTLGESTTAFWDSGPLGKDNSWPGQLSSMLAAEGDRDFVVENLAIPGCDAADQLAELRRALKRGPPALVIAMLGANDWGAVETARSDWRSLRILKFAAWLRQSDRAAQARSFNSELLGFAGHGLEKEAFLAALDREPHLKAVRRRLDSMPVDFQKETDPHFDFVLTMELHRQAISWCPVRSACRDLDERIYALADASVRRGDISRRIFHCLLDSGLALGKVDELDARLRERRRSFPDLRLAVPTADLLAQLLEKRPELKDLAAVSDLGARYGATRRTLLEIARLAEAKGSKVVFMQYPRVPVSSLSRLLDETAAPNATAYPLSFVKTEAQSRFKAPPNVELVSNEFFDKIVLEAGYGYVFTDRWGYMFGKPFGHMTAEGNKLLAAHLLGELKRRKLLVGPRAMGAVVRRGGI